MSSRITKMFISLRLVFPFQQMIKKNMNVFFHFYFLTKDFSLNIMFPLLKLYRYIYIYFFFI